MGPDSDGERRKDGTIMLALLKGISPELIVAREDQSVFTLHNKDGETVAEVVVGKNTSRANFKARPTGINASGKARNWPGGGVRVTSENEAAVRKAIETMISKPLPQSAQQTAAA